MPPTMTPTPDLHGCPRCGRRDCPTIGIQHTADCCCDLEGMEDESGCPVPAAMADCRAHLVDWRALYFALRQQAPAPAGAKPE